MNSYYLNTNYPSIASDSLSKTLFKLQHHHRLKRNTGRTSIIFTILQKCTIKLNEADQISSQVHCCIAQIQGALFTLYTAWMMYLRWKMKELCLWAQFGTQCFILMLCHLSDLNNLENMLESEHEECVTQPWILFSSSIRN